MQPSFKMECDICCRRHDAARLPFLCAVDARNQVYEGRIKHLQILLGSEGLRGQIQELLAASPASASESTVQQRSQQLAIEDRTETIMEASDRLKDEIKAAQDEIRARKATLARRRSDLATISDGLAERRGRQQKELEKSAQMVRFRWSQSAEDMSATRAFLCTEAASLYGLKRVTKKGNKTQEFVIGKVPVVDPTSMNSLSPEQITTSLGHICHILMLASHYLSIRLPAEITTPHRDYPFPTILNLSNSYKHRKLPFPGSSGTTTPISTTTDPASRHIPRPRPLYITKSLPQLAKDDPAAYSFFLEGVTLLAYDIAWLCSSQGILIGDKNPFDEVCQMGRNLYNLLIQTSNVAANNLPSPEVNKTLEGNNTPNPTWMGRYSHGTMYYSLSGKEGAELVKTFKLPSPTKLADKLRKKLMGDAPGPDWEVLSDDAWKVDDIPTEDLAETPVATPEKSRTSSVKEPSRGSASGWTKVR